MKPRMAHHLEIFLCDTCSAVHIGLFRNGKMFAEAIPENPEAVLADLKAAVEESAARQAPFAMKN